MNIVLNCSGDAAVKRNFTTYTGAGGRIPLDRITLKLLLLPYEQTSFY
jgi:hypothetical protein